MDVAKIQLIFYPTNKTMKSFQFTINFYNPKELWGMFWNRFYWPRRKQCAEWLEYGQNELEYQIIHNVLCKTEEIGINIDEETAEKLELSIKVKISETFDKLKTIITTPI